MSRAARAAGDGDGPVNVAPVNVAPVNVAQVPQRSPFRYAGGKTWFVPHARAWLRHRAEASGPVGCLVEPFAGGGIVGLTAAFENLAARVVLCERDADVAAVWQAITGGDADALAARIEAFDLTEATVNDLLATPAGDTLGRAFQTIVRNRVNRGGILAPGAGRHKTGENGRGLASRWYPATLARRIRAIGALPAGRIVAVEGDALDALRDSGDAPDAAAFIDPPYTAGGKRAGARLYRHHALDHASLFATAAALAGDVLMTYDDAPEVRELAAQHGFAVATVPMKSTHHARHAELVIGRDLGWR